MENELNVTCTSDITDFHPNNSPTAFTGVLNMPMQLNHEWKVALTSITFKNNFKYDSNFIFQFSYRQFNAVGEEVLRRDKIRINENVKTVKDIHHHFKKVLKKYKTEKKI